LCDLALISVESKAKRKIDFDKTINENAAMKTWKRRFDCVI